MNTNKSTVSNHRSYAKFVRASLFASIVLGVAFIAIRVQADTNYINPVGGNFNGTPGPKWNAGAGPGYVYNLPGTSSYTNTSTTGCYWVETSWGVHSSHNTNIAYSVNGVVYRMVNETLDVAGTAGSGVWSGFRALNNGATGIIILTNGVSQIVSATNSANTGNHTRGLWRTTRLTGTLINPTAFGTANGTSSSPGNGNYYYVNTASNSFAIGSALAPGVYKLEISWGVHSSSAAAVTYSYNQTGVGGLASATTVLTNVDQRTMNDGRAFTGTFGFGTWSGFRDLGTFTVGAGSQIWLSGGGNLTMGVIQATPVDSTTYIDPVDGTAYVSAGIAGPVLNGGATTKYTYNVNPSSSWISHNTNGNYWVEVSWGAYSATHSDGVAYSVDGTTYLAAVNQKNDVAGTNGTGYWSGFKALNPNGTNGIALTSGVSAITVSTNGTGTGFVSRALWRVSLLAGKLVNPTSFGTEVATSSSPGDGKYYFVNAASNSFAIGSVLSPGVYKLEVSWGVNSVHSSAVTYSYNQTGVGGLASATTVLTGVDQRAMNDGRAFTKPAALNVGTWSGFKTLGTFTVEAGSQIWLSGGGNMTMSAIQATRINQAPVATNFTMGAVSGIPATIKIIGGKYAPTDPDNDSLTVSAVNYTGGNGGVVTTDGTNATYTSANTYTGSDSFAYTVTDGNGGFATNTVTVTVLTNGPSYNLVSPPLPVGSGTVVLTYVGIPEYPYALDWATNLTAPIAWLPVITNTADTNGLVNFTNTSAASQNYFRTRQP